MCYNEEIGRIIAMSEYIRTNQNGDYLHDNKEVIGAAMGLTSILLCGSGAVPHEIVEVLEPVDVLHTAYDIEHDEPDELKKAA
jgi:hypothetical protein